MLLQIDDWVFDVDVDATRQRSALESADHCFCKNCQNFYIAFGTFCSKLGPFLDRFGLFWDAPDCMSAVEYTLERVDYDPAYYVFGAILQWGTKPLTVGNIRIQPEFTPEFLDGSHCFVLAVQSLALPWLLDPEDFEGPMVPDSKISSRNTDIPQ